MDGLIPIAEVVAISEKIELISSDIAYVSGEVDSDHPISGGQQQTVVAFISYMVMGGKAFLSNDQVQALIAFLARRWQKKNDSDNHYFLQSNEENNICYELAKLLSKYAPDPGVGSEDHQEESVEFLYWGQYYFLCRDLANDKPTIENKMDLEMTPIRHFPPDELFFYCNYLIRYREIIKSFRIHSVVSNPYDTSKYFNSDDIKQFFLLLSLDDKRKFLTIAKKITYTYAIGKSRYEKLISYLQELISFPYTEENAMLFIQHVTQLLEFIRSLFYCERKRVSNIRLSHESGLLSYLDRLTIWHSGKELGKDPFCAKTFQSYLKSSLQGLEQARSIVGIAQDQGIRLKSCVCTII